MSEDHGLRDDNVNSEKSANCFHFVNKSSKKSRNSLDSTQPEQTTLTADCLVKCNSLVDNGGLTNVTLCCAVTEDSQTKGRFHYVGKSKVRVDSYQKPNGVEITMESSNNKHKVSHERRSSEERSLADGKSVHAFIRNAVIISGSVSCRNGQENNDAEAEEEECQKTVVTQDECTTTKKPKRRVKRSRSLTALHSRSNTIDQSDDSSDSFNSSLESLIKHNISNAKALQPISVSKAKERNYLHGRSGLQSLLGRGELERIFPKQEITIFIATWNMNGEKPSPNLNELFLSEKMETLPDVYVIGTQESYSETAEWEIAIQETIGPTHVLFHSETLGTLFIAVFIRRELIWYCSLPEDDSHSVRPGSAFKTKGGVGICFYIFGSSFLFITAHLTAHDDKLQERISDVERIMKSLELPKQLPITRRPIRSRTPNVVHNFDYVFWFGDLNFRLTQPREQIIEWVQKQKFPMDSNIPLPFYDQLYSSMKKGLVFRGFQEAPITFPPTYKYDPGTTVFDTSHKKRIPSYTDRILFKCRKSSRSILTPATNYTSIKNVVYTSTPSFSTSDHKPVWGVYKCKLRTGVDNMPLAAGWFKRDVYLEALKRRAAHHKSRFTSLTDSKQCSIQ
ncbi:inositol polyphosphate 5-phosphatase E [Planococcus citri]|uniref:inositol polyphosphate 5-phosphatase E n=1 Tax=Planococcus citri TaxID=170843 RepID=UPI0031F8012C